MNVPEADLHARDGFATLETLVAFVILSLGLAVALQAVSLATKSRLRAVDAGQEVLLVKRTIVGLELEAQTGRAEPAGGREVVRVLDAEIAGISAFKLGQGGSGGQSNVYVTVRRGTMASVED